MTKRNEHRKLSDEELLNILNDGAELPAEDFDSVTDVPDFLVRYEITEGTNNVSVKEMYSLYVKFTRNPIPYNYFLSIILNRLPAGPAVKGKKNRVLFKFPPEFFVKRRIEKLKKPRLMPDTSKIKNFLKHYSIRYGINPVPLDVLYYKFCLFCEEQKLKVIGFNLFRDNFRHIMRCRHLENGDIVAMVDIKMTTLFPKDVCKFLLGEAREIVKEANKRGIKDIDIDKEV